VTLYVCGSRARCQRPRDVSTHARHERPWWPARRTSTSGRAYSTSGCCFHLSRKCVSRRMPVSLAFMLYSAICMALAAAAAAAAPSAWLRQLGAATHAAVCVHQALTAA
jgi:hypothetical protein